MSSIEEEVATEYFFDFGDGLGDGVVGGVKLAILNECLCSLQFGLVGSIDNRCR